MSSVEQSEPASFSTYFHSPQLYRKGGVFKLDGTEDKKKSADGESDSPRRSANFSDEDLDILLKRSGIEVTPHNRRVARYLLEHRVQLEPKIFALIKSIFGHQLPQGVQSEAMMAALSKLKIDSVASGYRIFMNVLSADQLPFFEGLRQLRSVMTDLISESFLFKNSQLPSDLLRESLEEKHAEWDALLKAPLEKQVSLLARRTDLVYRLHRTLRFFDNLDLVARRILSAHDSGRLGKLISTASLTTRRLIDTLLADAILSREDVHHHLTEQGTSHSLSAYYLGTSLSGRLWAHDPDNPASRQLDPESIVLFFRWFTKVLGVVEATAKVTDKHLDLNFASTHQEVVEVLEKSRSELIDRLKTLGYDINLRPATAQTKVEKENIQIEHRRQDNIHHLDAKA